MDQIRIKGLEIFARHGVYEEEKKLGQRFQVDVVLHTDTRRAGKSDDLEASTDYGAVCRKLETVLTQNCYNLIESAAEHAAQEILLSFPLVEKVTLELHKPQAPIPLPFSDVSVRIDRGWHTAYIALGSNMGDRNGWLELGRSGLEKHPACRDVRMASLYASSPYGGVEQEDFVNSALSLRTLLLPHELLDVLQGLEQEAGRKRLVHWGPRTLDLDLIFYDDLVLDDPRLIVPHPDLENRDFVLLPLCELAPAYRHPLTRKTVRQMLDELKARGEGQVTDRKASDLQKADNHEASGSSRL